MVRFHTLFLSLMTINLQVHTLCRITYLAVLGVAQRLLCTYMRNSESDSGVLAKNHRSSYFGGNTRHAGSRVHVASVSLF
ncbi:hypothetical protein F5Y04DRAFT_242700 [Hypomontagnella monticulosa]|nr:hypothetical protein F5Y04DRAFT_242700 [Hypomontagnella monticulosa]